VDAGKAVNPKIVETQISGGGRDATWIYAVRKKSTLTVGKSPNASLADYKISRFFHDLPKAMENLYVRTRKKRNERTIQGAKGVGESSMFCVSPAIANALDGCSWEVRLTELPLTPEAVISARFRERRPENRSKSEYKMTTARTICVQSEWRACHGRRPNRNHTLIEVLQAQFGLTGGAPKAAGKVFIAAAVRSSSMTIRSRVVFTLQHLSMARR